MNEFRNTDGGRWQCGGPQFDSQFVLLFVASIRILLKFRGWENEWQAIHWIKRKKISKNQSYERQKQWRIFAGNRNWCNLNRLAGLLPLPSLQIWAQLLGRTSCAFLLLFIIADDDSIYQFNCLDNIRLSVSPLNSHGSHKLISFEFSISFADTNAIHTQIFLRNLHAFLNHISPSHTL